jgi:hypothetical protein
MKNITLYKPKKGKLEKYVIRSRVRSVSELSVVHDEVSKLITSIEAIYDLFILPSKISYCAFQVIDLAPFNFII